MERDQEDEVSEESFEPRDLARSLGGRNGGKVAGIEQVEEAEDDSPDVTQKKLERVRRKLGIVRLSWPDKVNLTSSDEWLKDLPESYSTLSDLEKTLLWYAENFRRQFRAVHPHRKALLLTCANECSVQVYNDNFNLLRTGILTLKFDFFLTQYLCIKWKNMSRGVPDKIGGRYIDQSRP